MTVTVLADEFHAERELDGPFFHGTTAKLAEGAFVLPALVAGVRTNYVLSDPERVYLVTAAEAAHNWACRACDLVGLPTTMARVLEVEPVFPLDGDPNVFGRAYRTRGPARVVRVVPRSELTREFW